MQGAGSDLYAGCCLRELLRNPAVLLRGSKGYSTGIHMPVWQLCQLQLDLSDLVLLSMSCRNIGCQTQRQLQHCNGCLS